MRLSTDDSGSHESIVEIFDIFAGLNARLPESFDTGRVKVALMCHYLFSAPGHMCGENTGCALVIDDYYKRVRPTDSKPGREHRIDRLFDAMLHSNEARERLCRLDYRST